MSKSEGWSVYDSLVDSQRRQKERVDSQVSEQLSGYEFFFSNVLMKVYQVPNLFTRMSPNTSVTEDSTNTFLIMFHEKNMRKRMYAKTAT